MALLFQMMPVHDFRRVPAPATGGAAARLVLRCVRCGMTAGEIAAFKVTLCPVAAGQLTKRAALTSAGKTAETVVLCVY